MKMKELRIASTVLAFMLLFSVVSGCGTTKKSEPASTADAKKSGPPVELTVEVYDRAIPGYAADNNFMTKYIQEKFGTPNNITVKFVSVPRTQEVDKMNILMASNQAPDVSFLYDQATFNNYVKSGGLTALDDILKKDGQKLTKYLGDAVLKTGNVNGKQYSVPAKRVLQAQLASFIRKDWLDKLGMSMPKTTDEWYSCIKAFKEKDPGNVGKDKVVPFALQLDNSVCTWPALTLLESFKTKQTEEEFYSTPSNSQDWTNPGFKEGMKYLNKLFNEGLISPQFALDKAETASQYNKDISQGKAGFFTNNFDQAYRPSPGLATELKKNVPDAQLVPVDPFTNYEGKHVKPQYAPNGFYIFVPASSKHATEAIKYLDWMTDKEVMKFLQNGVKGDQYTDEKNGIPVNFKTNDQLSDDKKFHNNDLCLIANGKEYGDDKKNIEAASLGYTGFEAQFTEGFNIAMKDSYIGAAFTKPIDAQTKYNKTLTDKGAEIFVKSISCKPSDFEKTYDSLVQEYLKIGGQEVINERKAAYKEIKK